MQPPAPFRHLRPSFCSGLLDDPVLYVGVRPTGRGLLLDCGQLHHLAKRLLGSIDAVFVSHAHMDHLIGFDHLVRHVHVAPRSIAVYGPPGLAARIGHKLAGYDWNLAEATWCTLAVHEVHADRLEQYEFAGPRGFALRYLGASLRHDRTLLKTRHLSVEAELCDHRIPVLAFRVTESEPFLVDREKLTGERLAPGPWLGELERRFHAGDWAGPLELWRETAAGRRTETAADPQALFETIRRRVPPASIGYCCDLGMTPDNLERLGGLLQGVSLLVAECTFLAADQAKARRSAHLCTTDLNLLARQLAPAMLLPMHLSKSYLGDPQRLYAELDPPPGTRLLRLPAYVTPRPLRADELPLFGME